MTLILEPLFFVVDAAIVSRLGTIPLAGLSCATAVLMAVHGLAVFLAYSTTTRIGQHLGAGRVAQAHAATGEALWLAGALSLPTTFLLAALAEPVVRLAGARGPVVAPASVYLEIAAFSLPGALVSLAALGVLRAQGRVGAPLMICLFGFSANIAANVALVLHTAWAVAGSALGTTVVSTLTGLTLTITAMAGVPASAKRWPGYRRLSHLLRGNLPLLLRSFALRGALLVVGWSAAQAGPQTLAAVAVALNVWGLLAYALDAIALTGQAALARAVGLGHQLNALRATRQSALWGLLAGLALGGLLLTIRRPMVGVLAADSALWPDISSTLTVMAVLCPLAGLVFVLDGVLMGMADYKWLAIASWSSLMAFVPPALLAIDGGWSLNLVLGGFSGWLILRLASQIVRLPGVGRAEPPGRGQKLRAQSEFRSGP